MSQLTILDEQYDTGPYGFYTQLREQTPVFEFEEMGAWVVTTYEDVTSCLKRPELFSHESFWDEPVSRHDSTDPAQAYVVDSFSHIMMYKDGNPHTAMRKAIRGPFAPPKVRSRRPQVENICRDLLRECRDKGTFDYAKDFADRLPSMIVADYLGIPVEDREFVRTLSDRFRVVFEPELDGDERAAMLLDVAPLVAYLDELIVRRRTTPQDDYLSALAGIKEEDGGMTTDELRGNLMHLLLAGNETTTNLLSHMFVQLSRTPDMRDDIAADPDYASAFVEEALRFEAPLQLIGRKTTADVEVGGVTIPAGSMVGLGIGSANRDPKRFDRPDEFDPTREDKAHLSFASGAHFCIGAPLARLEGAVAAEMLAGEFSDLRVADATPEWKPDLISRGYLQLPAHRAS